MLKIGPAKVTGMIPHGSASYILTCVYHFSFSVITFRAFAIHPCLDHTWLDSVYRITLLSIASLEMMVDMNACFNHVVTLRCFCDTFRRYSRALSRIWIIGGFYSRGTRASATVIKTRQNHGPCNIIASVTLGRLGTHVD